MLNKKDMKLQTDQIDTNTWKTYVEPSGATLYGTSSDDSEQKAVQAVQFFLNTIKTTSGETALNNYLSRHNIKINNNIKELLHV